MLKQRPTLDITCSSRYQVWAQVNKVKSHFIQSARDNIPDLYDLHCFGSDTEHLELIDCLLADNKYLFPVVEPVEEGVRSPNPMQRESKAAHEWLVSILPPGRTILRYIYIKFYHQVNNCGIYADGFYNSMIDDKDGHIPLPLIMFPCTVVRHALLESQNNNGVHLKASKSKLKVDRPDRSNYFNYMNDGV